MTLIQKMALHFSVLVPLALSGQLAFAKHLNYKVGERDYVMGTTQQKKFGEKHLKKITAAFEHANKVVTTKEFSEVLKFANTKVSQNVSKIVNGLQRKTKKPVVLFHFSKPLKGLTKCGTAIGKAVGLNAKCVFNHGAPKVAGTIVHETLHLVGFSHPKRSRLSVPYYVGCIVTMWPGKKNLQTKKQQEQLAKRCITYGERQNQQHNIKL